MSEQSTVKTIAITSGNLAKALEAAITISPKLSLNDLIFVLFGASGNLASLKIFPALYQSYKEKKLPANFTILAVDRHENITSGSLRALVRQDLLDKGEAESKEMEAFLLCIIYYPFNLETGNYQSLKTQISVLESEREVSPNRTIIYFLSLLPWLFETTIQGLGAAGLLADPNARLAVEKPFGNSLTSAKALNTLSWYCDYSLMKQFHYRGI
ncbi:hypothetical protein [Argonema antarcticum]|uniref:hypothetical protein n=1 Tax=Argonema antarcticum TaxID=2942763 RepID=UPI002012F35C|nr:hypothetical protein [Argonema antarcticum]MCL1475162.1 hypothetical protein [Argonema antarcticum A004/B2]